MKELIAFRRAVFEYFRDFRDPGGGVAWDRVASAAAALRVATDEVCSDSACAATRTSAAAGAQGQAVSGNDTNHTDTARRRLTMT